MKTCILLLVVLVISVQSLSAQKFNSNSVVKIFNYQNVELIPVNKEIDIAIPLMGHGTGTMIDASGIILTNAHVVENARLLAVLIPGSDEIYPAKVVDYKKDDINGDDYAIICIEGNFKDFTPLPTKQPDYEQLDEVFALGYPMDFVNKSASVVKGIVSNVSPEAAKGLSQMDASINPGNSGGPVTNKDGVIVGINVSGRNEAEAIKYFVPIGKIIKWYNDIKSTSSIQDKKSSLANEDYSKKELKRNLLKYLVNMKKKPDIIKSFMDGDFGTEIENTILKISNVDSTKYTEEMSDIASITSALYYNLAILDLYNYIEERNKDYLNSFYDNITIAMSYADKAFKIDATVIKSGYIQHIRELKSKFPDPEEERNRR